jgi:hypothetical protein
MKDFQPIVDLMMKNDLADAKAFVVSNHQQRNPERIDVKADEVVYISDILFDLAIDSWLEFHSATESRIIEKVVPVALKENVEMITRHKGNIYFSKSSNFNFDVTFVKLKIIK